MINTLSKNVAANTETLITQTPLRFLRFVSVPTGAAITIKTTENGKRSSSFDWTGGDWFEFGNMIEGLWLTSTVAGAVKIEFSDTDKIKNAGSVTATVNIPNPMPIAGTGGAVVSNTEGELFTASPTVFGATATVTPSAPLTVQVPDGASFAVLRFNIGGGYSGFVVYGNGKYLTNAGLRVFDYESGETITTNGSFNPASANTREYLIDVSALYSLDLYLATGSIGVEVDFSRVARTPWTLAKRGDDVLQSAIQLNTSGTPVTINFTRQESTLVFVHDSGVSGALTVTGTLNGTAVTLPVFTLDGVEVAGTYTGGTPYAVDVVGLSDVTIATTWSGGGGPFQLRYGLSLEPKPARGVTINGTPAVTVSGTPAVTISGTPAVTISGTPAVTVSGTPAVNLAQVGGSNISATNGVPVLDRLGYTTKLNVNSAATTNATSVKASAGTVQRFIATNVSGSTRYLKFYDKASAPTVGTDTPMLPFGIGPNGSVDMYGPMVFANGIAFAITANPADSDATAIGANEVKIQLLYD